MMPLSNTVKWKENLKSGNKNTWAAFDHLTGSALSPSSTSLGLTSAPHPPHGSDLSPSSTSWVCPQPLIHLTGSALSPSSTSLGLTKAPHPPHGSDLSPSSTSWGLPSAPHPPAEEASPAAWRSNRYRHYAANNSSTDIKMANKWICQISVSYVENRVQCFAKMPSLIANWVQSWKRV